LREAKLLRVILFSSLPEMLRGCGGAFEVGPPARVGVRVVRGSARGKASQLPKSRAFKVKYAISETRLAPPSKSSLPPKTKYSKSSQAGKLDGRQHRSGHPLLLPPPPVTPSPRRPSPHLQPEIVFKVCRGGADSCPEVCDATRGRRLYVNSSGA
jgi:hypothetical protein